MPMRNSFGVNEIYHVFNKSIAKFKIFNTDKDFYQIINIINYYRFKRNISFSHYSRMQKDFLKAENSENLQNMVKILCYCIMPTHLHLILQSCDENDTSISLFMNKILNSYTHYFNGNTKRQGPLWASRFKSIHIEKEEQLLHLTRYIHLNPVTAYLVEKPEHWRFSSYNEYCGETSPSVKMCNCNWEEYVEIKPEEYQNFVEDNIAFQRDLAKIKKLLIE